MNRPTVGFESHPPERRHRASTTLYGGTTCCCCCCLHSIGGIIGAAFASAGSIEASRPFPLFENGRAPTLPPATGVRTVETSIQAGRPALVLLEPDEDRAPVASPAGNGVSACTLFWWLIPVVSLAVPIFGAATGDRDFCASSLIMVALCLPAVQFASAFIVAVVLCFSSRPDRAYQFGRLGRIVIGTFVGSAVGVLVMVLIG